MKLEEGKIPNVIYGLTCACHPETGIRYVGLATKGYTERWRGHKYDFTRYASHNLPVYNWIKKHGWDNIRHTIIEACESREELSGREVFWIACYRSTTSGLLNITDGGSGLIGYRHSEETKARISAGLKGRVVTESHREKMRQALTGRKFTDEHKLAMSLARIGKPQSPERAAKSRESIKKAWEAKMAKPVSEETREKIRQSRLGTTTSPETRAKISAASRGRVMSVESKKKLSASHASKLTEDNVREIRRRLAAGEAGNRLAVEFGISDTMMSLIKQRRKWAHVDD